jgi:uncharacterized C2H2 Zn-finger protein
MDILSPNMASEEKKTDSTPVPIKEDLTILASDFQCSVCGVIFTTDQDRKQHMEKEAHGELHEAQLKEMDMAKEQEDLNESRYHHI